MRGIMQWIGCARDRRRRDGSDRRLCDGSSATRWVLGDVTEWILSEGSSAVRWGLCDVVGDQIVVWQQIVASAAEPGNAQRPLHDS